MRLLLCVLLLAPVRAQDLAVNAELEFDKDGLPLYQNGAVLKFKRE
jgi:hypothetical protein